MIINHNLPGMNAIRNMNANSVNASKSMQKLSSGLRINSAADDAAGLAISEKMRGQIRGLDQASANAQDGISMIQTGEGALSETTSILQRMRELAVQSSNDTNTADDRKAVQTEMNQLTSEINRIGNTTEFNTQKVLNGGTQVNAGATASAKTLVGGMTAGSANVTATATSQGVDNVAAKWNTGAISLTSDLTTGDKMVFNYGGTNYTVTLDVGAHTAGTGTATGATSTGVTLQLDSTDKQSASVFAAGLKTAFDAMAGAASAGTGLNGLTSVATATTFSVTDKAGQGAANNANLMTLTSTGNTIANSGAASQSSVVGGGTLGVTAVAANGTVQFTNVPSEGSSITIAGKKISFYDSTSGNFADATAAKTALTGSDMVVDIAGITTAKGMAQATLSAINNAPIPGYTVVTDPADATGTTLKATASSVGLKAETIAAKADAVDATATGSMTFSSIPTQDSKVTIGASTIGFYDSSTAKYADAADAKAKLGTTFVIDTNGKTTANNIKDAVIALSPQMTDVTLSDGGIGKVSITAASQGAAGDKIKLDAPKLTTLGFTANLQIGANTAQSLTVGISDMRSQALNISSNTGSTAITAKNGSVANFVSTASVTDGTSNINSEFSLDVSTNAKSTAAVSVLDDAISAVSSQRSQLGAYQNRLEHTINNLGTSSENLTSAESRIRDVDMAKEMATFSKNNILAQAAQAMLAQANQQPQQVLQLLR